MTAETGKGAAPGRVIVNDAGFRPAEAEAFVTLPDLADESGETGLAVDMAAGDDPEALRPSLARIALIRIDFPVFSDGRGFTLARDLRRMGYAGRLRAAGHVISDQYRMARACGFDEVEIDAALARRQPEADWGQRRQHAAGYLGLLR